MPLPILALAIASFCIGTTEFVIMGLLPEVAADLGVSIPSAGLLVTGYALGVVIGAPIIAIATASLPRKPVLIGLAVLFVIGNLFCALAPSYWMLMIARVVTAFGHGAFFGIGSVVAANLVPRHKRASAIALMFAGLTLANILGVPAGTALGEMYGWRATFLAVVAIGIAAVTAIVLLVPATSDEQKGGGILSEIKVLGKLQVWLAMLISALASAGLFAVFTYIKPILTEVSGISAPMVTWILLLFGAGMTVGQHHWRQARRLEADANCYWNACCTGARSFALCGSERQCGRHHRRRLCLGCSDFCHRSPVADARGGNRR